MVKLVLLSSFLLWNLLSVFDTKQTGTDTAVYEVVKVQSYQGKCLQAVFKINYKNKRTHNLRFFEVIKTNAKIKNHFLADFLLIERIKNGQKMIYYPTGWESVKSIKEKELKETCQLIVKGSISSETME
jgi:hypothetical protein